MPTGQFGVGKSSKLLIILIGLRYGKFWQTIVFRSTSCLLLLSQKRCEALFCGGDFNLRWAGVVAPPEIVLCHASRSKRAVVRNGTARALPLRFVFGMDLTTRAASTAIRTSVAPLRFVFGISAARPPERAIHCCVRGASTIRVRDLTTLSKTRTRKCCEPFPCYRHEEMTTRRPGTQNMLTQNTTTHSGNFRPARETLRHYRNAGPCQCETVHTSRMLFGFSKELCVVNFSLPSSLELGPVCKVCGRARECACPS